MYTSPCVKITEPPAAILVSDRYEKIKHIVGVNSTQKNPTYPTIEVLGCQGNAIVVISCVTHNAPYRAHPFGIVSDKIFQDGACTVLIDRDTMRGVFSNLRLHCLDKRDLKHALDEREFAGVDPFGVGFSHKFQPETIDLNAFRLCFQVFLETVPSNGIFKLALHPVVSDPIYTYFNESRFELLRLNETSSSVLGNTQNMLMCKKIKNEHFTIEFYEQKNNQIVWQANAEIDSSFHLNTIGFKTPRYHTIHITEPAKVFVHLRRRLDGLISNPLPFEYTPLVSDSIDFMRKSGTSMELLRKYHSPDDHQDDGYSTHVSTDSYQTPSPASSLSPFTSIYAPSYTCHQQNCKTLSPITVSGKSEISVNSFDNVIYDEKNSKLLQTDTWQNKLNYGELNTNKNDPKTSKYVQNYGATFLQQQRKPHLAFGNDNGYDALCKRADTMSELEPKKIIEFFTAKGAGVSSEKKIQAQRFCECIFSFCIRVVDSDICYSYNKNYNN